jgi:hypothetical protein
MVALTAGGVGGLAKGQHIDATDVHPARVWGTLLKAHGLSDTIGEVSGVVPGLL